MSFHGIVKGGASPSLRPVDAGGKGVALFQNSAASAISSRTVSFGTPASTLNDVEKVVRAEAHRSTQVHIVPGLARPALVQVEVGKAALMTACSSTRLPPKVRPRDWPPRSCTRPRIVHPCAAGRRQAGPARCRGLATRPGRSGSSPPVVRSFTWGGLFGVTARTAPCGPAASPRAWP